MTMTQSPNEQLAPSTTVWRENLSALKLGIAQLDITPPVGIESGVWGASKFSRSQSVHIGLFVTVLAREDINKKISFIVGIDLCALGCNECAEKILSNIVSRLKINRDQLLFSSSHSHSTPLPCIHRSKKDGHELVPEFIEQIIAGAVKTCKQAAHNIADTNVTWVYGKCDLAVNRDLPCGSNEVVAFNPAVKADDTLAVGRVSDQNGDLVGVLVNYACHPTTLAWDNRAISPDYVGQAREIVETSTKVPMLFLQGASGDLSPRNQYSGDTSLADKNGENLGHSVLATLAAMQSPSTELRWQGIVESGALLGQWHEFATKGSTMTSEKRIDVDVRVKELKSIDQLREEWAGIDPDALEERIQRATRLRIGFSSGQITKHPVWVWQWGDAFFIAQPGEAYSFLQTELRRRNPDRVIFVLNLTNNPGLFYLPTKSAYVAPAYQAWQTLLAPGALDAVIEAADTEIKKLIGGSDDTTNS